MSAPAPPAPPPQTATATTTTTTAKALPHSSERICLIGLGAIGISFLALHLTYTSAQVRVYDPRPDLEEHIRTILPVYLPHTDTDTTSPSSVVVDELRRQERLVVCSTLEEALEGATIVQEQGPEKEAFKRDTWRRVVGVVDARCRLWSSTSGISASRQLGGFDEDDADADAEDGESGEGGEEGSKVKEKSASVSASTSARQRLLVVHPFNPPHIMPLLELVPSPTTHPSEVEFARQYFLSLGSGHRPIVIHKETKGFVANRLGFILLREACHLVNEGVVSVEELDEVMRASVGPRWAVKGVFEMYGFGGGTRGIRGFLDSIGGSIGELWDDAGQLHFGDDSWKDRVVEQTDRAYGLPTTEAIRVRDAGLKAVVRCQEEMETGKVER